MKCLQKWSFELGGLSWDPKAEQVEPEDKRGLVGCAGKCDLFSKCLSNLGRCFPQLVVPGQWRSLGRCWLGGDVRRGQNTCLRVLHPWTALSSPVHLSVCQNKL